MLRKIEKLLISGMMSALSLMVFCGAGEALSVTLKYTATEIKAGAKPMTLGAEAEGAGLQFAWELTPALGKFTTATNKSVVMYAPPQTIDGDSEQVTVSVRVTEANGNDTTKSVTLTIVGGDKIPPTPKPHEISCPTNFSEINIDKVAEWKKQGETNIPQNGVIAALLGVGSQKDQKDRGITLVWIESSQQILACWSVFPERTTEEEYLSEVRKVVPEFSKIDSKMLKRLNELWKQDKHVVFLP